MCIRDRDNHEDNGWQPIMRQDWNKTLPEAQRTQGIDFLTWVLSPANKKNAICIGSKFGHQVAPLALFANLTTRWRHLHELQIWPPDGATCISYNFDRQMAPLALVANLPTRWHHLHCFQSWPADCISCIATLLYWHYQILLSWYLHQPESHQISLQKVSYLVSFRGCQA